MCSVIVNVAGFSSPTGALVLLALQVLTPLFYYIPNAALAAVIISAVIQMVDVKVVQTLWKYKSE